MKTSTRILFVVFVSALAAFGCQAPAQVDHAASLKPVVDTFIDTWNTGELDQLDAILATDFRRREPRPGATIQGIPAMKETMGALRTAYPDIHLVLNEEYYQEDIVFVRWTFKGTNTGAGDPPPTGKSVVLTGFTALHFRDGKLILEDVYFDSLDWMQQLGFTLS